MQYLFSEIARLQTEEKTLNINHSVQITALQNEVTTILLDKPIQSQYVLFWSISLPHFAIPDWTMKSWPKSSKWRNSRPLGRQCPLHRGSDNRIRQCCRDRLSNTFSSSSLLNNHNSKLFTSQYSIKTSLFSNSYLLTSVNRTLI